MKNFIVGTLIFAVMAVFAVICIGAVNKISSPHQASPFTYSPVQLSNYDTTPRIIRSWRWNDCIYTLFEVDGHEYLQAMVRPSNAISMIHHAGCPCMKQ